MNIPDSNSGFLGWRQMKKMFTDPNYLIFKADIEKRKKFGDVYASYAFLTPQVTVWDPEILKQIYIKEFNTFPDRQKSLVKIQGELNDGLTAIDGEQWKRVRNTLSPTFSSSKLKQMLPLVLNCGDKLVENLNRSHDTKKGFDVKITLSRFTMDVITSASFSGDFHVQAGDEEPAPIKVIREAFAKNMFANPVFLLLVFFPFLEPLFTKMDYSIWGDKFRSVLNGMVNSAMQPENRGKRADILQLMLKAEVSSKEAATASKGLTKREIYGNSQLMLLAGYETTSSALMFLIYNLAMNPTCQDQLREEIKNSVDEHGGELNYESINDIKYLNMCLEESLRIYPPAPLNQRVCDRDITIKGYNFLKGMLVQIPLIGFGRDEKYWNEPLRYNPERMRDMSKIDPLYHQPFGAGPRNCIGMRLALLIVKVAICKILLNFQVLPTPKTPAPPLELAFGAVIKSVDEIELKVTPLET